MALNSETKNSFRWLELVSPWIMKWCRKISQRVWNNRYQRFTWIWYWGPLHMALRKISTICRRPLFWILFAPNCIIEEMIKAQLKIVFVSLLWKIFSWQIFSAVRPVCKSYNNSFFLLNFYFVVKIWDSISFLLTLSIFFSPKINVCCNPGCRPFKSWSVSAIFSIEVHWDTKNRSW